MPQTKHFDCIVLGLGGFGSAAAFHLAKRGAHVLGLEQFALGHHLGSSHGETRIIRQAYFEHPDYVPLLERAYELWRDLEVHADQTLLNQCGLMLVGPANGEAIPGSKRAAELHGLSLEELDPVAARTRFPQFVFPDDLEIVYEEVGGYLLAEDCVRTHLTAATRCGAELRDHTTVVDWQSDGRQVTVTTTHPERGSETVRADHLVLTAGAWTSGLLQNLGVPLRIERKPVFWFPTPSTGHSVSDGMPVYYYELPQGSFYGNPSVDGVRLKVAQHIAAQPQHVDCPADLDRTLSPTDREPVQRFLQEMLPSVTPQPMQETICMYTHSPDGHFILDHHPKMSNVLIAAGFSGHGFKFTSVLGEAMAELTLKRETSLPVEFLELARFLA